MRPRVTYLIERLMLESGVYDKKDVNLTSLARDVFSDRLPKDVGAMATFMGVTKEVGKDEKQVTRLEMQSYENHANSMIRRICREVQQKYSVTDVRIYHLIGEFRVGEPIVFVAVAGKGRREVFEALQEAVERYKSEPALWKKEVYVDGSHEWISHA